MSWASEILADNPSVFLRLDEVGAASDGQSVPDSSGNSFNGQLLYSGGEQVWGFGSFVETDAASRAYRGFGGGINGLSGHSRIIVPHDASMAVTNNFACEGGVQVFSDIPTAGTFGLIWKQGPGGIGLTSSGGTKLCAFCFDSAATLWVTPATFNITSFLGTWFHVAAERVGNALALYINGGLNNSTTIGSGLPTFSGSNPFRVHSDPGAIEVIYDEGIFYTHSNGGARYLVHYEAAINATLLNGYSNVVPSAILYSDEELPPISFPFRHNWSEPFIERVSFATNISKTRSGSEENGQGRPKPRREIEIAQVLKNDSERRRLRAKLWANQQRKWFVPIRGDMEQLTAPLSSGGNSIPVTPQYRDYEIDSWIGLRQLDDQGQIVKSEELEIQTLNAPSGPVITKTNLVNSYVANLSYAYPIRRGYLDKSIPVRGHSDAVESLTVVARLLAEDEKATPNRITIWTPTITYKGYEVFDPAVWQSNDWTELRDHDVDRQIEDIDFDLGAFTAVSDTPGAGEAFTYRMLIKGRDKQAQFLGWFYARSGSLNYLWVPTMQKDFTIVTDVGSTLTIQGLDYSENYAVAEARRDLAFVYNDNTLAFRRVLSVSGSPDDILTLDLAAPTQTNLRSLSLLKFCRMDGDGIEIARITDDVARFAWRLREMLSTPS